MNIKQRVFISRCFNLNKKKEKQNKMARQPKSQTSEIISDNTQGDNTEMSEMMKIIMELKNEISELKKEKKDPKNEVVVEKPQNKLSYDDEYDDVDIRPDSYIKVISLTPYMLNLATETGGRGKVFSFSTFGTTKRIMYSDLVNILEVNHSFMNSGLFYIADRRVIRKNGLDEVYEKILTKEMMEGIISGKTNDAVSVFLSANKIQQELIITMLIEKLRDDPDSIDLNLIDKISRASGVKIQEKVEEARELDKLLNPTEEKE
jgi:hypothetical protein